MKTLLLDMDGPIVDFEQAFYDLCCGLGFEMDIEGLHDLNRKRFMSDNIVNARDRKIARGYIEAGHNRWFRNLPMTKGADKGIAELLDRDDVDLWVCTKPMEINDRCRDDKGLWLREHLPELEHRMILAPDKSLIRGDVLLDDAIRPEWLARAEWRPVVFTDAFNGAGSEWETWEHWTWGDPVDKLLGLD